PFDLGMRLEVNHPLYALAWLGGGELIAQILSWRVNGTRLDRWRFVVAVGAVVAPVAVIAAARGRVFAPLDPAVSTFHTHIEEFFSLPRLVQALGPSTAAWFAGGFLLLLPAGLVVSLRDDRRMLVAFTSMITLPLVALACW